MKAVLSPYAGFTEETALVKEHPERVDEAWKSGYYLGGISAISAFGYFFVSPYFLVLPLLFLALYMAKDIKDSVTNFVAYRKIDRSSVQVHDEVHSHLKDLGSAIRELDPEHRAEFHDLWEASVIEAERIPGENPDPDELLQVNKYLIAASTAVWRAEDARSRILSVLAESDRSDPEVQEIAARFEISDGATRALESVTENVQASLDVASELKAKLVKSGSGSAGRNDS